MQSAGKTESRIMQFTPGQHIHFVGIGGAGLSAIARILLERGLTISGSDRTLNPQTTALARDGATIYEGHDAKNIQGADMVIISSAIKNNPEVQAAEAAGIPVYKRKDIMAALMEGKHVIAVAGTAGKTTTTAMIVHILRECGVDAGYIVGGVMLNTGTNAGNGRDDVFVIEADEYDNMFHGLRPNTIVLTNAEWDHPDFFPTEQAFMDSFMQFMSLLDANSGALIACADDPGALKLYGHKMARNGHTYGLSADRDDHYYAANVHTSADGHTQFDLYHVPERIIPEDQVMQTLPEADPTPKFIGSVRLALAGRHNVLNAVAALTTAQRIGVTFESAIHAIASFKGTGRRMEMRGEANGVIVIDDYAHHPTKIKATLEAVRMRYPDHQIWAVWQPHTYSRTQTLLADFLKAFDAADQVLITPIYAARETPIEGIDHQRVAAAVQHPGVRAVDSLDDAAKVLLSDVTAPAIILIMSAGDAPRIGEKFLAER